VNSIRSLGGERGSRFGFLFALTLAAGLLGMSLMAGSASAGSVSCGGTIKPNAEALAENALTYNFKCSEDIQGYSVITNRELGFFGTDIIVTTPEGEVSGTEAFTCEGAIPGNGTGCYGKMLAGNSVTGDIATTDELCEAATQPKFWIVAMTTQYKKDVPFSLTSEPFSLPIHCDTLNAKKKAADKAVKLCAKVKLAKSPKSRAAAKKRCQDAIKASKKLHQA